MKITILIILLLFSILDTNVNALEIDEKLTLRFLKVSSTKKTVLINRGGEDGLVVGDHAKFFITAGVVARGVVEKVSPTRSVWSLYRVVDPEEIVDEKVLNLKIATPAKITDDPSKSLKEEPIPGGTEEMSTNEEVQKVNNDEGSIENEEMVVNDSEQDELKSLGFDDQETKNKVTKTITTSGKSRKKDNNNEKMQKVIDSVEEEVESVSNFKKTWEVWGTLQLNSLSGTFKSDDATSSTEATSATSSALDFSIGIEKYFINYNNFFKEVSLFGFIHSSTLESGDSIKSKTSYFDFGAGANYHFYNSAAQFNRLIGFGTLAVGKGTSSIESKSTYGSGSQVVKDGDRSFISGGLGAKYTLVNGFGIKAILDYFNSSETYKFENSTETRTLSGVRLQFGLLYRF
jgi:hypothetical protein